MIDRREDLGWFYVTSGAGTIALTLSSLVGGSGVSEIIRLGASGEWSCRTRRGKFNWQAWLALIGTILVLASAFLGDAKDTTEA